MTNFHHEQDYREYSPMWLREVSRGNVKGAKPFYAFGKKTTTAAIITNQVIWPNGAWSAPSSSGEQMNVVSSSTNDVDVTGTGARKIRLIYLNADLEEMFEDVSLNGTTDVLTTATDIRFIQCAFVIEYGSLKNADGNISISNLAKTANYSYIAAGELRCSSSARMVPAGKRLLIFDVIGSSTSGTAAVGTNIQIASSKFEGVDYIADSVLVPSGNLGFQDNSFGQGFAVPFPADTGTVIALVATTDKSNIATISGSWYGVLEDVKAE